MSLIAISDIHLGAGNCESKKVLDLLDMVDKHDRLIINGDMLDAGLQRLKKKHWEILSKLAHLSRKHPVIYVRGNHEEIGGEMISSLTGMALVDNYHVKINGVSYYFEHGHLYDDFIIKNPGLTAWADGLYNTLQTVDPTHTLAKWAKRQSKAFLRCTGKVKNGLLEAAAKARCDWAVAGHTHFAEFDPKMRYINLGTFTERPAHYLTVNKKGEPKLHVF